MKKRIVFFISILFFISLVASEPCRAQCSMCRAAAESNLKMGQNKRGKGLNHAILYLMAAPYVLVGVGGYLVWRNRKK